MAQAPMSTLPLRNKAHSVVEKNSAAKAPHNANKKHLLWQ
jgi:hypothetical protein